jgi:hypothetical protein
MDFNPTRLVGSILATLGLIVCGLWYFHISAVPQDLNGTPAKVVGLVSLLVTILGIVMIVRGNRQESGEELASRNLTVVKRDDRS